MSLTTKLTAMLAVLLIASSDLNSSQAAEPNDSFADATVLPSGTTTVSDMLEGGTGLTPDTYLGFFSDDTFPLPPLAEDDDSSPLGDGLADALFGMSVNADGSIPLAVTGCCDDFDGSHTEEGDYELFVDVFDAVGTPIDSFSTTSSLMPGIVDEFAFGDPAWIGGTFDAMIDNTVGLVPGTDPIDFWVFNGLIPGATYSAEIVAGDFDTILAIFDSGGSIAFVDDDSGVDLLSQLTIPASPTGELIVAVSGFSDFGFLGLHQESGSYELTLSLIPEPTAIALLLAGLNAVAACTHRRRAQP